MLLDRYTAGESEAVWNELRGLAEDVRQATYFRHARAVANETMRRLRSNVEMLVTRLTDVGYQFRDRSQAHVPPASTVESDLSELEGSLGPLPISLRAFYEFVGSVDFTQSPSQLIDYHRPERENASEVETLGEADPLVVAPLTDIIAESGERQGADQLYFCFAPDEFHKAIYSGGENYHVWLPNSCADFQIVGMYDIDEWFVDYLRATCRWGGFRGTVDGDEESAWKVEPRQRIVHHLARGLLPL